MTKKPKNTPLMTREDAARIQSRTARTGTDRDFARRAQSAADRRSLPKPAAPVKKPGRR